MYTGFRALTFDYLTMKKNIRLINWAAGGVFILVMFSGCQMFPGATASDKQEMIDVSPDEDMQKDVSVAIRVTDENGNTELSEEYIPTIGDDDKAWEVDQSTDERAQYEIYSAKKYSEYIGSKPFVLFFHSNWCPICKRMEEEIKADLKNYPDGTLILKTDFDTETDLRLLYNVNNQSTVLVFNDKGAKIYGDSDPELDDFKAAIARSLQVY